MDIPLGRLVGTVRHFASGITPHPGPHRAARLDHHRAKGACSLAPVVAPGGQGTRVGANRPGVSAKRHRSRQIASVETLVCWTSTRRPGCAPLSPSTAIGFPRPALREHGVDPQARVTGMKSPIISIASREISYDNDSSGRPRSATYGNGMFVRYTYDDAGRLSRQQTWTSASAQDDASVLKATLT